MAIPAAPGLLQPLLLPRRGHIEGLHGPQVPSAARGGLVLNDVFPQQLPDANKTSIKSQNDERSPTDSRTPSQMFWDPLVTPACLESPSR